MTHFKLQLIQSTRVDKATPIVRTDCRTRHPDEKLQMIVGRLACDRRSTTS